MKLTVGKELKEAIRFVLKMTAATGKYPLKMINDSDSACFYFDEELFESFLANNITKEELFGQTLCTGLYRNINDIEVNGHEVIDANSLFMEREDRLILVDKDDYKAFIKDDNFEKI